ncbi:MAG: METTL5 family protein [Candidatus Thorarchaeota archaeon]
MPSRFSHSGYEVVFPRRITLGPAMIELYLQITKFIDQIVGFQDPKVFLEQYSLPSDLIAFILILAAEDLTGKNVVELGCGTGRFTLPIQKFFAARTLGVDVDWEGVLTLAQQREHLTLDIELLVTAIEFLEPELWGNWFQTTIMNPPFGTKRRKIDLVFLEQALQYSQTIISLHKANRPTRRLIEKLSSEYGKRVERLATVNFILAPQFQFHRKTQYRVLVDVLRVY